MMVENYFLDPSILLDKRAVNYIAETGPFNKVHLFTTKELSPERLTDISDREFSEMRTRFGGRIGKNRQISKEVLMTGIRDLPITYFSALGLEMTESPHFFDPYKLQKAYHSGWKYTIDIDELWFLAVHSIVLTRIKKREQDLVITLYRLVRDRLHPIHLTLEEEIPNNSEVLESIKQICKWGILFSQGAAALHLISPLFPFLTTGPLLLSFKI